MKRNVKYLKERILLTETVQFAEEKSRCTDFVLLRLQQDASACVCNWSEFPPFLSDVYNLSTTFISTLFIILTACKCFFPEKHSAYTWFCCTFTQVSSPFPWQSIKSLSVFFTRNNCRLKFQNCSYDDHTGLCHILVPTNQHWLYVLPYLILLYRRRCLL